MTGRTPPYNLEAEQGAIGSVLFDPTTLPEVGSVLPDPESFYRDAHRTIWRVVLDLADAGTPPDLVTVLAELGRRGEFDRVGGDDYLAELIESVPHSANARYYAEIVREKATKRRVLEAAQEVLTRAYADDTTAAELVETAERLILAVNEREVGGEGVALRSGVMATLARVEARREGRDPGVPTGFTELDYMLSGLQPRKLYVLAARPAIGKSALALNVADHAAVAQGVPTLFVSLEMDHLELFERWLSARGNVPGYDMRYPARMDATGGWHDLMRLAGSDASAAPLTVLDPPHLTVGRLAALARRQRNRQGLGLLVVDYLQLVDGQPRKGELREQEVARVSRRLKGLAKELNAPVLALCQLNRAVESRDGHKPRLSDLRESGSLEQDADVVMLLHRPDYYDPEDHPGEVQVIVAKHRGGSTGTVTLRFEREYQRFTDMPQEAP